nr:MAG: hypothetical protein EDM05_00355 [Leptolyngbya sp. IPPAS B-1204]
MKVEGTGGSLDHFFSLASGFSSKQIRDLLNRSLQRCVRKDSEILRKPPLQVIINFLKQVQGIYCGY